MSFLQKRSQILADLSNMLFESVANPILENSTMLDSESHTRVLDKSVNISKILRCSYIHPQLLKL